MVENNERLFGAAKDGDIEELTRLLSCGASPDGFESKLKKTEGYTALKVAISTSHVSCAKALIRAGADVNHVDAVGFSTAHVAALHGAVDCVHVLARSGAKLDLVCGGAAFLSPIVLAAIRGHASCVTAFARLGVDVDGRCDQRRTALMSAMRGEELANGLCSCRPLLVSGVKAPTPDVARHLFRRGARERHAHGGRRVARPARDRGPDPARARRGAEGAPLLRRDVPRGRRRSRPRRQPRPNGAPLGAWRSRDPVERAACVVVPSLHFPPLRNESKDRIKRGAFRVESLSPRRDGG